MTSIPAETTDIWPDLPAGFRRRPALLTYQPSGRYWPFQWYELAIYLGATVMLASFCFWWVRRRAA